MSHDGMEMLSFAQKRMLFDGTSLAQATSRPRGTESGRIDASSPLSAFPNHTRFAGTTLPNYTGSPRSLAQQGHSTFPGLVVMLALLTAIFVITIAISTASDVAVDVGDERLIHRPLERFDATDSVEPFRIGDVSTISSMLHGMPLENMDATLAAWAPSWDDFVEPPATDLVIERASSAGVLFRGDADEEWPVSAITTDPAIVRARPANRTQVLGFGAICLFMGGFVWALRWWRSRGAAGEAVAPMLVDLHPPQLAASTAVERMLVTGAALVEASGSIGSSELEPALASLQFNRQTREPSETASSSHGPVGHTIIIADEPLSKRDTDCKRLGVSKTEDSTLARGRPCERRASRSRSKRRRRTSMERSALPSGMPQSEKLTQCVVEAAPPLRRNSARPSRKNSVAPMSSTFKLSDALDASCCVCSKKSVRKDNDIGLCDGCNRGFHQQCHNPPIRSFGSSADPWYCSACMVNARGSQAPSRRKKRPWGA